MQTLTDIISYINTQPESEKGRMFEVLCLYFLKHDTIQQEKYSGAWLWKFWPGNEGKPDTGIDIAAKISDSDSFCAVQCKFRHDDSTITKAEIDSFLAASSKSQFSERILFTLTGNFGGHAPETLAGQNPPVKLLTLQHLEASSIDWSAFSFSSPENVSYSVKKLLPHQVKAVDDVMKGFREHDRGRLIMACGTGKTFTSLKIAERLAGKGGLVLVLVPSISLLNQTLLAWSYDHDENIPLQSFAVCSDSTVGRYPEEDLPLSDLAVDATTDEKNLLREYKPDHEKMTVIFSTYQSLDVINRGQKLGSLIFDLIICDEAHRTAGLSLKDKLDSGFRRIHDDSFIHARKRLYMTATPKVYGENAKASAQQNNLPLYSMDDTEIFGPEFFSFRFSNALDAGLLSDYRVIIFSFNYDADSNAQIRIDDKDSITLSDGAKIIGIRKALAKQLDPSDYSLAETDPEPMKSAVVFTNTIKQSETFAKAFRVVTAESSHLFSSELLCETDHIDGKTPVSVRSQRLFWLKNAEANSCRILSNARCLSEGVDVPALDAVVFFKPKSSEIDIVQSVGRVMRKAEGKTYGYVIIPIAVKPGSIPDQELDKNEEYSAVWRVLKALRSHDDKFQVVINDLSFNGKSEKVIIVPPEYSSKDFTERFDIDYSTYIRDWEKAITAKIVDKCGDREYWDKWIQNLADLARRHADTLKAAMQNSAVKSAFTEFADGLRQIINPSITDEKAAEMLAQHITSRQVFDELFSSFSQHNPVSKVMQKMLDTLTAQNVDISNPELENFYKYVHEAVSVAKTDEAKQEVIRRIYESFFRKAFKDTAEALGIVYTPKEIVNFILRSADWAVKTLLHIPEGLSADGVHILDPFSGTGQFTARLLQIGLIPDSELKQKYKTEIHANEILLLAYYISAVNIEAAFQAKNGGKYLPFPGMVLTDTFNLPTDGAKFFDDPTFFDNSVRIFEETKSRIDVIIGNPPYSTGKKEKSGGTIGKLDDKIADTYGEESTAANKNSLYDSYIRAFRWASDRLKGRGIICYVSNGSYIDSNSADGLRKCLVKEFTHIYIFNLRGNQRGGDWRKEGQKIFGEGSQCPIAITLLVKDGTKSPCRISYYEVGDYLTREEKLAELVRQESFGAMESAGTLREIVPNLAGDWVNQRGEEFGGFMKLGNKNEPERDAVFGRRYSAGGQTKRDAWCYNFSREALCENMRTMIDAYNKRLNDPHKIAWTRGLRQKAAHNETIAFSDDEVRVALYRPYVKMMMHFSRDTNEYVLQIPQIFPKPDTKNMVICVSGVSSKNFSVLMTDTLPELHLLDITQCFPLFWYEERKKDDKQKTIPYDDENSGRRDGISSGTLNLFRSRYQEEAITKEDIFSYIYGVLSSREYAERFGKDTKKLLARVPAVKELARFRAFRDAGRELGRLHVGYEDVKGYALREEWTGTERDYTVKKMKVADRRGERVIRYNDMLTLSGIPSEAWEYVVNGRSALEWIVERYSDSVDGKSGLRNDGNAWGRERGDERYIVELIRKVVSVSVETARILRGMPELGV